MLATRATIAFLALPAVVAGLVPALITRSDAVDTRTVPYAIAALAVGVFLLLWCVRDFFLSGRGTLAPWDPPKRLVIVGLYRAVRNPMYIAVLTILAGWALLYTSVAMVCYLIIVAIGFHIRVVFFEEPWLKQQFGAEWEAYRAKTPRWVPGARNKSIRR